MPTEQNRDDETVSDLPESATVTDEKANMVKGGAVDQRPMNPVPPPPPPAGGVHNVPRSIDPCW
jgi:hypothetical protein